MKRVSPLGWISVATFKETAAFIETPRYKNYSRSNDVSYWQTQADNYLVEAA